MVRGACPYAFFLFSAAERRLEVMWEWKDDEGSWNEFHEDDAAMLESKFGQ